MKILLICGHGDGDCGALGTYYQEQYETREFAKVLKQAFNNYDCVCDIADDTRNYYTYLKKYSYDFKPYDYVLEIHFNAFNGKATGTEIIKRTGAKVNEVETQILKNIADDVKYINRGVKFQQLYVMGKIQSQGVQCSLLEVCFIDNENDMSLYEVRKSQIAQSIVNAFVECYQIKKKEVKTMRYNHIEEIPEVYRSTIKKLIDKGILKGNEKGLDLSEDMIRVFVILDRSGAFDR